MITPLIEIVLNKIEEFADNKLAAAFFNKPAALIAKWKSGAASPSVLDAQLVLDSTENPAALLMPDVKVESPQLETPEESGAGEVELTTQAAKSPSVKGGNICLLLPVLGPVNPFVAFSWLAHMKRMPGLGVEMKKDTILYRSRNTLVDLFLKGNKEWSLWMDGDMIAPTGNPKWFKEKTGSELPDRHCSFNAIEQIMRLAETGERMIGGVYVSRSKKKTIIAQPAIHPRDVRDSQFCDALINQGPKNETFGVDWLATGFLLVHRSVYEDVKIACPEIAPKVEGRPWGFFNPLGEDDETGEDICFSRRVQKAGISQKLDCSLFISHLGTSAFNPVG